MPEKQGWETSEAAYHYLRTVDVLVPWRREILSVIADLAAAFTPDEPRMLDIGSGAGDVTAAILEVKPKASVCMVDFSDEMNEISQERFRNNPRVRIVKYDANDGIPGGRFDCVVSCFAIHHVEPDNRVKLYSSIHEALPPGGLFITGDRFVEESAHLSEYLFDQWISVMVTRIRDELGVDKTFTEVRDSQLRNEKEMGDKPGTVWETSRDLRLAGFKTVDCVWKHMNLAIITAVK